MIRAIGNADDYWRVRVTRVDTTEGFEFEWHDDILYRAPEVDPGDEVEYWHVEAVMVDDPDHVVRLATFVSEDEARSFLAGAREDLTELTKSQFEDAYFAEAETGDTGLE